MADPLLGPLLVLDALNMKKPCRLFDHDGDRPAPAGGLLLYCLEEHRPTEFADADAAQAAIGRTVAHLSARGIPAQETDYLVASHAGWAADQSARRKKAARLRDAKERRAQAKAAEQLQDPDRDPDEEPAPCLI